MDIYDLIKDLQSFDPDMSEYPRVTSGWLTTIKKFHYDPSEWIGTDTEAERVNKIREYMKERTRTQGLNFKTRYGADNNKAKRCQCIQTGRCTTPSPSAQKTTTCPSAPSRTGVRRKPRPPPMDSGTVSASDTWIRPGS